MTMTPYNGDLTRALKWQQNNAPNIQSIVQQKANWYAKYQAGFWTNWQANIFDLATANSFGLVVWCIILGIPLDLFNFSPVTNAFAYGAQRGNYLDGGGNVAPIQFASGSPTIYANGAVVPGGDWSLNETSDEITFTSAPATGAVLTWTGTVTQQTTGQVLIVNQPRQFGTGNGSTVSFSLIPSDSENYNETGNNFYGGGSSSVGLLSEIRYACQLRYIALVSNGRQQWINQMLQFIFNDGEAWDFASGNYFYLTDGTQATQNVVGATIFCADWEGNKTLYSTPRTNLLYSTSTLAGWTLSNVGRATGNGPDGTANGSATLTPTHTGTAATITAPTAVTTALNTEYMFSVFVEAGTAPSSLLTVAGVSVQINWSSGVPSIGTVTGAGYVAGSAQVFATGVAGWYRVRFIFNSLSNVTVSPVITSDATDALGTLTVAYPQVVQGTSEGQYIPTTSGTATRTDYTLNAATGAVVTAVPPANGAVLTWSGTWQWASTTSPQQFGTGNGTNEDFTLTAPPGAIPPVSGPVSNYMEYRVGPGIGLSSQFINILNTPAYGIMPQCAGIQYAVVQES
jgi:hypothetical protein